MSADVYLKNTTIYIRMLVLTASQKHGVKHK